MLFKCPSTQDAKNAHGPSTLHSAILRESVLLLCILLLLLLLLLNNPNVPIDFVPARAEAVSEAVADDSLRRIGNGNDIAKFDNGNALRQAPRASPQAAFTEAK